MATLTTQLLITTIIPTYHRPALLRRAPALSAGKPAFIRSAGCSIRRECFSNQRQRGITGIGRDDKAHFLLQLDRFPIVVALDGLEDSDDEEFEDDALIRKRFEV